MQIGEGFEIEFPKIPIRPVGAREVRELEIALIIGTILRPDVFKEIMEPREFTTWVDSLAVAAGALAREKAGYTISRIAEELGRSETTIRNHLQGKTKAGQLVKETYDMLKMGKLKITLPFPPTLAKECEEAKRKAEELSKENEELKAKLDTIRRGLEELLSKI